MEGYGLSLAIIVVCVIFSAYFSATETAFNSLNRIRIKNLAEKGNKRAQLVQKILGNYDRFLSTTLIGNNVVNISATSVATVIFVQLLGEDMGSGVSTLVITLVLLIFGEISPKSMAFEFSESFAMFSAPIIRVIMVILTPVSWLFEQWKKLLKLLIKGNEDRTITEEELLTIVEEAHDEGGLDEQESSLIRNSIEFMDQEAQDILTPRVKLVGVEPTDPAEEIMKIFAETGYSRLPVYEEDLDHIVGILHQKDFYNKVLAGKQPMSTVIRPALFVTPTIKIGDLLKELQKQKLHIAVVLDEYGGTTGIVTMEDILEELVGEIWDEHDEVIQEIRKISDQEYIVKGSANMDKLREELSIKEEIDPLTVNGWVFELAGEVPAEGDACQYQDLTITVLRMDGNRVDTVRIIRKEEEPSEQQA